MYSLTHDTCPWKGDSGGMSVALTYDKETQKLEIVVDSKPIVGYACRVGSSYARSMQSQDYWTTTPVKCIIEDTGDIVKFETLNGGFYTWKRV